ncbi:MAG: MotA/TolQ/ExbB proton channel family protein [Bacteroidales bacterium]|nr:MotA/TolQ/ExbB proton channel family protein [Bacteroidales bacterium]MCL2133562.1 MotA/TolQ/ExbB proton channel family protein [Bacteroidales bacterium]
MLLSFLQIAATEGILTQTQEAPPISLFDMAVKGGPLMLVLFLLSIVAVYIFAERWWAIRKASKIDVNFMNTIKDFIHDGKIKSAISLCERNNDKPIVHLIEKGLSRLGRPLSDIREAVENTGNAEVARLERGLPILASIAGGAPMIGFLGTVIGMIQAFYNMASAGNNIDITMLSSGLYVAMVTTVGGLIVGIMAYFGYNYLTARVGQVVYKMDTYAIEFMDILNEPSE